MKIKNVYTSIACNHTLESVDWGTNGLIIFGACNSVALFDPNFDGSSKIINTFVQHTARVNTVKWIKNNGQNENSFVSGADDGLCIVWIIDDVNNPEIYCLKEHTNSVTVVDSINKNNELLIITASADSSIKFWCREENSFNCFQTISLHSGFCFSLTSCLLPNTNTILLAYSTDDDNIILASENSEGKFEKIHLLKGHEDWVRGLDFCIHGGDVLLASSSQDTFIRIWRISPRTISQTIKKDLKELLSNEDIQIEEKLFTIVSLNKEKFIFAVSLESVLQGHECWVYSVNWDKNPSASLQLLSSSIDKCLILWSPTEEGLWMDKVRVGEVGGNSLGFFGGKLSPNGKSILGHGYQGGFHIWNQSEDDEANSNKSWTPGVIIGGHFSEARDICWEPQGTFLFSLSADQTTRIHGPWIRENNNKTTWHELARPQVHGYDMQCLCVLSRYKFASGAEEKIVRTFQAPVNFIENLQRICKLELDEEGLSLIKSYPMGASVPSLGLSNKAVYETEDTPKEQKHVKDEYPENYFIPITLNAPPPEETLMQNTLWPEVQKLYGHGYEIFSLCSTSDGKLIASACKATTPEHAKIILWDTQSWKQIQNLSSHQLTVTQMKFSPNKQYLLTVSRDRRWTLFETKDLINYNYELVATTDKKNGVHGRIIWTCDWTHDSLIFITGSRDGKIVPWIKGDTNVGDSTLGAYKHLEVLELKNDSITSLAVSHNFYADNEYLIAIGLESGIIHLHTFNKIIWKKLFTLDKPFAHHLTVKKLAFRPESKQLQLASCGNDHLVRIYELFN